MYADYKLSASQVNHNIFLVLRRIPSPALLPPRKINQDPATLLQQTVKILRDHFECLSDLFLSNPLQSARYTSTNS